MATLAERIVYGRPQTVEQEADETHLVPRATSALVARILIAAIFVLSGFSKLTDDGAAAGYMTKVGIPHADTLVIVAGIAELVGGLAVMLGLFGRLAALGLFVFLIPTTLLFHGFWNFEGAEAKTQMVNFMKNLSIMGGLLLLFARGPSKYSVDAKLRKQLEP